MRSITNILFRPSCLLSNGIALEYFIVEHHNKQGLKSWCKAINPSSSNHPHPISCLSHISKKIFLIPPIMPNFGESFNKGVYNSFSLAKAVLKKTCQKYEFTITLWYLLMFITMWFICMNCFVHLWHCFSHYFNNFPKI